MKQYDLYRCQKTVSLNGGWLVQLDPERIGEREKWFESFPSDSSTVDLPMPWNISTGHLGYEGTVWYQRELYCTGGNYLLIFYGVADQAEVYFDGVLIGSHYGAFTPFSCELKAVTAGIHRLTVAADNTKNMTDTLPLSRTDWFPYGGIIRDVELLLMPEFYVRSVQLNYQLQGNNATLSVTVICGGIGEEEYRLCMDEKELLTVRLKVGENTVTVPISDVELWSPENPKLYYFTLASEFDSITERTGFRTVTTKDGKILLNGAEILLNGVNRHDIHPDWGFAVPNALERRDIDLIRNLGCNIIRGSHYPPKDYLLDLCDEQGILYWSEIPLWQYESDCFSSECLIGRSKNMILEMMQTECNHPSVILWGLHNECATDSEQSRPFTAALYEIVRQTDPTRLITYATDRPLTDLCFEYCDVISVNKYYGWYEGGFEEWDTFFENFNRRLTELGQDGKPIIMSEFGAGAIYGYHTFEEEKWSEEYQSRCIAEALERFEKQNVAGTFVWQFSDTRTNSGRIMRRPRGFNNKGIVDEYRRPKKAYETVRRQYCNECRAKSN